MRKIEFRGKNIVTGKWETGDLLQDNRGEVCIGVHSRYLFISKYSRIVPVNKDTVGQYTGLIDKAREKIFEGDILGSEGRVIGWVKGGVRGYCYDVVYINHPAGESDWPLYSTIKYDYPEQIEVIGNIHDNPDLLEGGER